MLFRLQKKEIPTHATTGMNPEDIMLSERSQSQKEKTVWFHLGNVPRIASFIATESSMVVARGWGWGNGGFCLTVTEFQFCKIQF